MKTPARLIPLIKDGLIDEVLRPLMNGKEAAVYVVRCGDEIRCAKAATVVAHAQWRKVRSLAVNKLKRLGKMQKLTPFIV